MDNGAFRVTEQTALTAVTVEAAETVEEVTEVLTGPNAYALTMLYAINRTGKHIYGGTVPQAVIDRRRKANKRARAQRKINRQRS